MFQLVVISQQIALGISTLQKGHQLRGIDLTHYNREHSEVKRVVAAFDSLLVDFYLPEFGLGRGPVVRTVRPQFLPRL